MYTAIEALAETVDDSETAKLAKDHRRQEERMATFLERLIPQLTKDVARAEIPAAERRTESAGAARARARSGATRGAARPRRGAGPRRLAEPVASRSAPRAARVGVAPLGTVADPGPRERRSAPAGSAPLRRAQPLGDAGGVLQQTAAS